MQLKKITIAMFVFIALSILIIRCSDNKEQNATPIAAQLSYGGFGDKVKWGEHLVTIDGCGDCHTPKKMTAMGPVDDSSLLLSGHPEHMPIADIDRKQAEAKGLVVTNDLTSWVGPWGVSYTANLTPDSTSGIGAWTKDNFVTSIRKGKKSGISSGRDLLPPMPWQSFKNMTDDELDAMFAYLLTIKPIHNNVPAPMPPLAAMHP